MKRLRSRIIRLLDTGTMLMMMVVSGKRQKLEYLVKTKKWYPYTVYVYTPLCAIMLSIIFTSTKNIAEQLNK